MLEEGQGISKSLWIEEGKWAEQMPFDDSAPDDENSPSRQSLESIFQSLPLPQAAGGDALPTLRPQRHPGFFHHVASFQLPMHWSLPPEAFSWAILAHNPDVRDEERTRGESTLGILNRAHTVIDAGVGTRTDQRINQHPTPVSTSFQSSTSRHRGGRVSEILNRASSIVRDDLQIFEPNIEFAPGFSESLSQSQTQMFDMLLPEPTPLSSDRSNFEIVDFVPIAQSEVWAREDSRLISSVIDVLATPRDLGSVAQSQEQPGQSGPSGPPPTESKELPSQTSPQPRKRRKLKKSPSRPKRPPVVDPQDPESLATTSNPGVSSGTSRGVAVRPAQPTWHVIGKDEIEELERMALETDPDAEQNEEEEEETKSGSTPSGRFRSYQTDLWLKRFREFIEFRNTHGHTLVPNHYPENTFLAQWTKRQRYQRKLKVQGKHSTVSAGREKALDRLGFIWESHSAAWMERWNELAEYHRKHGHSNVPTEYPENRHLSIWVKCQRRQYKLYKTPGAKSNMTPQRIAQLESLDFVWNPRGLNDDDSS